MAKRMFVALDLPVAVAQTLAGMDPHLTGLRWLASGQLHLTLSFLPAVEDGNECRLLEGLAGIHVPGFTLGLRGMGLFGRRGAPSVIWAGVVDEQRGLVRLQRHVRRAVLASGLDWQGKRFRPHVTVGRCKDVSAPLIHAWADARRDLPITTFQAAGFTLYHSILHPEGAEHRPVGRWRIPPPADE